MYGVDSMGKTSDAQKRATLKYSNSKYRPNIYVDKEKETLIKNHCLENGFDSVNSWVNWLIDKELGL